MDYYLLQPHYWLVLVIVDNILYLLGGSIKDGVSPAVFTAPLDTVKIPAEVEYSPGYSMLLVCSCMYK